MKGILMDMPKYESYKDSGFEPYGAVPAHWDLLANRNIFTLKKSQVGRDYDQYDLLSLTLKGVIKRDMENPEGKFPAEFDTYQPIEPGDFIFCLFDVEETPRTVGISPMHGMITGAYTVFEVSPGINHEYLHYLYYFLDKHKMLKSLYRGLRNTIPKENFYPFKSILPPKEEQDKIVEFLNGKTSQIDKAIEIKEKQIALLKERKQIIIQNAVTKGLDPNVPMKDSGVEWIGEIPEHWKVEKLFGLCRFVRGNSPFTKDELLSSGKYSALQYGKTYQLDEVDHSFKFYVNEEFYKESQVVNFGNVIFISTSETIEDLGHSAIYTRNDLGLIGGEQILIKPYNDLLDHYYIYYSSKVFSKTLRKYATGIKVFRFNVNDLKTIYIAVPPKEEQVKIASYIKDSLAQIDKAIDLQQAQINKLKEYKASLINSAVTGKIKVV